MSPNFDKHTPLRSAWGGAPKTLLPGTQVVLVRACLHCGGGGGRDPGGGGIACDSLDCGVFFERVKARAEAAAARALCDAGLALL